MKLFADGLLTRKASEIPREGFDRRGSNSSNRRSFLGFLLSAGGASVSALLSVPLLRFILHPLIRGAAPLSWTEVAKVEEFDSATEPVKRLVKIEQRDGWRKLVSEKALYVCKDANGQIQVYSSVCPHLGCSIAWRDEKGNFVCPCHNGQFTSDGKLLGGPPRRGMDLLESKIEDGVLLVHYQYFRQLIPNKEVLA